MGGLEGRCENDAKNRWNNRKRSREQKAVRLMQNEMKTGDLEMGSDGQSAGIMAENNVMGGQGKGNNHEKLTG